MTDMPPHLTRTLSSFARMLVTQHDTSDLLYRICEAAVETVKAAGAAILLQDVDGRLRYAVASDAMARQVEQIQLDTGEGPCLLAHRAAAPVLIPQLEDEARFPAFSSRALDAGMRAVFTFPLLRDGSGVGILDVYRDRAGALTGAEVEHAQLLADLAAVAVLKRRAYDDAVDVADSLQAALDARIAMEQAKGRVSEQVGITTDAAEQVIHRHAAATGTPLASMVRRIAAGQERVDHLQRTPQ